MSEFLKSNSLLISAPVVLHPRDEASQVPPRHQDSWLSTSTKRSPKVLGVHMDTSLTFNVHSTQAATRVSNRNNIFKALAGTTWGQQKETILMTYKAIGRLVANYGASGRSTNASATSIGRFKLRRAKP